MDLSDMVQNRVRRSEFGINGIGFLVYVSRE
jgi:hypothetical protein